MKKAVIFDLDGTLLYTLDDLTDSVNFAVSKFNYPNFTSKEIQTFIGNGISKLIERAIPQGKENRYFEECLKTFKTHYSQNMMNKTKPYDKTKEILIELKRKNIKIAVLSNKFDSATKELCDYYFPKLIDINVGESAETPKKPNPQGLLKIINDLNLTKEECVYVGDSEVDILTAKNANIECISVDWGYKSKDFLIQNEAKTIVSSPEKLLKMIIET